MSVALASTQFSVTEAASVVVRPVSRVASQIVRPVFYDETQRRRVWFFSLTTLFMTAACFLLAGFVVSVRTPSAFAAVQMLPSIEVRAQVTERAAGWQLQSAVQAVPTGQAAGV